MSRPPTAPAMSARAMMPVMNHLAALPFPRFALEVLGIRACSFSLWLLLVGDGVETVDASTGCSSAGEESFILTGVSTALAVVSVCPQFLQKRAMSGTSVPQAGQFGIVVPPCREDVVLFSG